MVWTMLLKKRESWVLKADLVLIQVMRVFWLEPQASVELLGLCQVQLEGKTMVDERDLWAYRDLQMLLYIVIAWKMAVVYAVPHEELRPSLHRALRKH
jgi:hypothetical protein